ncbi:MAG TPA: acyltransferase [Candidatus Saccharimonadales bacterium]|jgi:peptidoglycan/LPS O-acetylase OafA/YrhL|nr:acyltransferase [Candidatus Saccharimonadales bacterium]
MASILKQKAISQLLLHGRYADSGPESSEEPQMAREGKSFPGPAASAQDYLPTLDGWRAVACFGVIIGHGSRAVFAEGGSHPHLMLNALTQYGGLGVDVFFAISGLLICTRLLEEEQRWGRISLKSFYIRRAFRILPPYILYLAAVALISGLGLIALHGQDLLGCAFFFRNYIAGSWCTTHFWSLAVEEHFYLLWPGLLFFLGSKRSCILAVAMAVAVALWRALEFRHGFISHQLPGISFYLRTDIRLDALLWGCWMALLLHQPLWRERLRRWISPVVWSSLAALYVACVAAKPHFSLMWQSIILPLLLAGTLLHPWWRLGRLLESWPMLWIGRISYSLYLWQQLFMIPDPDILSSPVGYLQRLPLNIVATFTCASLSYYLLERRMMRIGRQLASPPSLAASDLAEASA